MSTLIDRENTGHCLADIPTPIGRAEDDEQKALARRPTKDDVEPRSSSGQGRDFRGESADGGETAAVAVYQALKYVTAVQ